MDSADSTLVSICIPCRNAVNYVGPAIESVLAQTWRNLEVIVVDDDSTDGSSAVLDQFVDRGVTLIRAKCGSASRARNVAYSRARGAYVKYFDADDLLNETCIEEQMARLAGNDRCVASSAWGRFYADDIGTFKPNPQEVWCDMAPTEWLTKSWYGARPMMQPGMFLIPRAVHQSAGLWDEQLTLIDDFEFLTRILCHSTGVRFAERAVLYYRSGLPSSLSSRRDRTAVESAFQSLHLATGHLLQARNDSTTRQACANILQDFIYTYYPEYGDLRKRVAARVRELGGSNLAPAGPPRFERLRRVVGWKIARRIQRLAGR